MRVHGPHLSQRPCPCGHPGEGATGTLPTGTHPVATPYWLGGLGSSRHIHPALLMSLSASSQAKSSEEMGHWLGLLLSESGSKTDPEEFTYDYVDADRVSCIVSAAKTSLL